MCGDDSGVPPGRGSMFVQATRRWKRRAIVKAPSGTGVGADRAIVGGPTGTCGAAGPVENCRTGPGGTIDNSPPVHWRERVRQDESCPGGTPESAMAYIRSRAEHHRMIQASLRDAVRCSCRLPGVGNAGLFSKLPPGPVSVPTGLLSEVPPGRGSMFVQATRRWKRRAIVKAPSGTGDGADVAIVRGPSGTCGAAGPVESCRTGPGGTTDNSPPVHWRERV
jgi:hypothetical protein